MLTRVLSSLGLLLMACVSHVSVAKQVVVYQYVKPDGTVAYTDRKPVNHSYHVLRPDCFACDLASPLNWHQIPLYTNEFEREIIIASKKHQVEPALIRALIHAESSFRVNAKSKKGAMGLMQLMPATAKQLGVNNPFVAKENILGGVKYLAELLDMFNGNIKLATAAYNAGPNAVKKHKGVPPFKETKAYVTRVAILHSRYRVALN